MSDETTAVEEVDAPEETGKGLRAQLEAALQKNREHDARDRVSAFKSIGLDVDSGYGKAIAMSYSGEPTEEAVAAYAKDEFGYVHETQPTEHPLQGQIQEQTERLDQVGNTAGSVAQPSQQDVLAKAEADGDYRTTLAIKSQQIVDSFRQGADTAFKRNCSVCHSTERALKATKDRRGWTRTVAFMLYCGGSVRPDFVRAVADYLAGETAAK